MVSREEQNKDTHGVVKCKAEEIWRKSLEIFSETRDRVEDEEGSLKPKRKRGNGNEAIEFQWGEKKLNHSIKRKN